MLRSIAKAQGTYVVGLFDCCREKMAAATQRGLGANSAGIIDVSGGGNAETQENFIMTYGCPPTEGVPAKSTIANAYIKYLKSASD